MPNTSRYSSTNLYILYIRRFLFAYLIFVAFIIVERYNDDFPNKKSTEPKLNNLPNSIYYGVQHVNFSRSDHERPGTIQQSDCRDYTHRFFV